MSNEASDENKVPVVLSPCHAAKIDGGLADGVLQGSCSVCHKAVSRVNPITGTPEWLDGHSTWTNEALRPVEELVKK